MVGSFSDFDGNAALKPVNGISMMNGQGDFQPLTAGHGAENAALLSVNRLDGGK